MSANYFLDTNIFVYSFDNSNPVKQNAASHLIEELLVSGRGVVSFQVVQEFINVSLKKFETPMTKQEIERFIEEVLSHLWKVYATKELYLTALSIKEQFNYSFYDSVIISAALEAGCSILYSEDLQHEQKIYTLQIINPFADL